MEQDLDSSCLSNVHGYVCDKNIMRNFEEEAEDWMVNGGNATVADGLLVEGGEEYEE